MKQCSLSTMALVVATLFLLNNSNALVIGPSCHKLGLSQLGCRPSCVIRPPLDKSSPCSQSISLKRTQYASKTALHLSAADNSGNSITANGDHQTSSSTPDIVIPLSLAAITGIATTLLGFIYAKFMKAGFRLLWKTIPAAILNGGSTNTGWKFLQRYPAVFIVVMTTFGGAMVAYLSSKFPNLYSAHDYVHILSKEDDMVLNGEGGEEKDVFPSAMAILPVMILCLVTSLSGFSLGPEAPMVTVGSLAGASIARKYHHSLRTNNTKSIPSKSKLEKTLAYAGAAGSLTGFMNIPLAGPIFALEMTSRHCGVAASAIKSWTTAVLASLVGISFIRGMVVPNPAIGGHFDYISRAAVGAVSGRDMIAVGLGCGVGGALIGTGFHSTVRFLKGLLWPKKEAMTSNGRNENKFSEIMVKIFVALVIGILSTQYPQTMFWGEGSLQCMVDGQCTPFAATPHGLPMTMMQWARVNPNEPLSSGIAAAQIGIAKFLAISLASAAKFPGGVIFPLLSNGAGISHSFIQGLSKTLVPGLSGSLLSPLMVMSFMAATLTSITRTPMATCLILAMSASGITPLSVLLPGALLASYVSVFVSEKLSRDSFFEYSS